VKRRERERLAKAAELAKQAATGDVEVAAEVVDDVVDANESVSPLRVEPIVLPDGSSFHHLTVLREETVGALEPKSGGVYADVTLGGGGHTELLLEQSAPEGRVIGVDRDERALAAARERLSRFGERATLVKGEAGALPHVLESLGIAKIDGVMADLGVSSPQLDDAGRGFSFRFSGPLDMRMDPSRGETAKELCERLDEAELANVIYQYGDERKSRPIARSIKRAIEENALETTDDLRAAVHRVIRPKHGQRIDPATRTFQALRIAVNDELGQLEALLACLPDVLADGGVASIISFHSLEDRLVKEAFRSRQTWECLTRSPVVATEAEIGRNPRSRSAKLRVASRRTPAG